MVEKEEKKEKLEEKTDRIFSIVTTTRAKYFGLVGKNGTKGITIDSAYEITNEQKDAQSIANGYIKGLLYGDNKRIELSDSLIESTSEAIDETRIVRTYESLLPEAKKRAIGVMTYQALNDLLKK